MNKDLKQNQDIFMDASDTGTSLFQMPQMDPSLCESPFIPLANTQCTCKLLWTFKEQEIHSWFWSRNNPNLKVC